MVSLYFHIPFCTRKCPYCHFYVIPNKQEHRTLLLDALLLEFNQLLPKLSHHEIVSIYFGGGTPTLFGVKPIETLLTTIFENTKVAPNCEITIEANPEEITKDLMKGYKQAGINRVSIGVQSLQELSLRILERTHNATQALDAIATTYSTGLKNISIDLMYELPHQTSEDFEKTLNQLDRLPISHLSLYNLTIEPNTAFFKRTLQLPSQEENLAMLQAATTRLDQIGLKRYEISAFAKPGFESRHNIGYWTARPFFGLGPSAFSYYDNTRYRNWPNINRYAKALKANTSPIDFEESLPYPDNVHELLAVQLRLLEGVDITSFDLPPETHHTLKKLTEEGFLTQNQNQVKLSEKGLLFYDTVASEII